MGQDISGNDVPLIVPVLPLRDVVVYPHMVIPLFVGREKSIQALDAAMQDNKISETGLLICLIIEMGVFT